MTLGVYHRNWSSISGENSPPLNIDNVDRSFGLYPNPTSGDLNIKVKGMFENQMIHIVNMYGQIVKEVTITHQSSKIDLVNLPSGMYIAHFKKNRNFSAKFIKK
jgi:hypothetical protein